MGIDVYPILPRGGITLRHRHTVSITVCPMTKYRPEEAKQFLDLLGKNGCSRLRALKGEPIDGGCKHPFRQSIVERAVAAGNDIYLVIGNGGDDDESITSMPAVFCEWDDKPIDWQETAWRELGLPEPSFQVATGGKSVHTYWVLNEPIKPDRWRGIQLQLIQHCQSDKSLKNPSRVMRVPGYPHQGTGHLARLINVTAHRYAPETLEQALPATAPRPAAKPTPGGSGAPPELVEDALRAIPPRVAGEGQKEPSYDDWLGILWGMASEFGPDVAAAMVAAHCPGWGEDLHAKAKQTHGRYSIGTLFYWAKKHGWQDPRWQREPDGEKFRDLAEEKARLQALDAGIRLDDYLPAGVVADLRRVTKYINLPDAGILMLFLTCASVTLPVGSTVVSLPGSNFKQPMLLFCLLIGRSGTRKSPCLKTLVREPLDLVRKTLAMQYEQAMESWKLECQGKKKDERPDPPHPRVLEPSGTTGEALEMLCANNEPLGLGAVLSSDEFASVIQGLNAYRNGRGGDQQLFLELYDGAGRHILRIKSPRHYSASQVSVVGGIQPAVVAKMLRPNGESEDSDGLWSRFVFTELPEESLKIDPHDDGSDYRLGMVGLQRKIHELFEDRTPRCYRMDTEAKVFFSEWAHEMQEHGRLSRNTAHSAVYGKSAGKAQRIAGLCHHIAGGQGDIGLEQVMRAAMLVEWADEHAISILEHVGDDKIRTTDWLAKQWLHCSLRKDKRPVAWSDVRRGISTPNRKGITAEHGKAAMEYAVEMGWGVAEGGRFRAS
jgi:hypothetical protein